MLDEFQYDRSALFVHEAESPKIDESRARVRPKNRRHGCPLAVGAPVAELGLAVRASRLERRTDTAAHDIAAGNYGGARGFPR